MFAHPGKKLLFMGGEFGQWREWNHDQSLDWHLCERPEHDGLKRLVQHLNWVYKNEPALFDQDDTDDGFEWIDFRDGDNSVVAFLRKSRAGESIAFVINATPIVAVRPGRAPMITPTSDEARAKKMDCGVMNDASECPKAKRPSNIRAAAPGRCAGRTV